MNKQPRSSVQKTTSKDVAALANVSQSTVSRVLNLASEQTMISEDTAKRVIEAANLLGYSPNPIARALRGEKTNMIGLIVREITDPFFSGLIELLNFEARKNGLTIVLGHAQSDPDKGVQMARVLDSRQVDGIIFLGDLRNDKEVLKSYIDQEHPIIALCRGRLIPGLVTINCDNKQGIRLLVDYLMSLGHKDITFVDGGWFGDILERREEFIRLSENLDEKHRFSWIQADDDDFSGGYEVVDKLLSINPKPSAVICSSDTLSIGLMKAFFQRGFQLPDDFSMVGFDDITVAKYIQPSLTTIRQPIEEMAEKAIEMIIKRIHGIRISPNESLIELTPQLMIRESVRNK